jgi:predicted RNA binding protein YcfA (HicA-like mRNA interferase family)
MARDSPISNGLPKQKRLMPKLSPISRRILIKKLKSLKFSGPHAGTRHQFMTKGEHVIIIPNPHGKDIGIPLLKQIIKQVGINKDKFISL